MKRGLKTFARAVRDGDIDKAKEMYGKIVQGNMDDGLWEGYQRALKGIVEALDSSGDLTFTRQIADDKYSKDRLEEIKRGMESRASQEFRAADERGFNMAWADVLKVMLE